MTYQSAIPDCLTTIAFKSRAFSTCPGPSTVSQRIVHWAFFGGTGASLMTGGRDRPCGAEEETRGLEGAEEPAGGGAFSPHDATPNATNADAIHGCSFMGDSPC